MRKFQNNLRLSSDSKAQLSSKYWFITVVFMLMQHFASYGRRDIAMAESIFIFAIGLPVAIAPWMEKQSKNIAGKAFASFTAVLFSAASALPTIRTAVIAKTYLSAALIVGYVIFGKIAKKEIFPSEPSAEHFCFQMFFAVGGLVMNAFKFKFIGAKVPFLWVAAALGILFGVAVFMPIWRKKDNTQPTGTKIGVSLIICVICAVFSWGTIANFNYILDKSAPTEYHAEIQNKRRINKYRGGDDYEFTLTVDGKTFKLKVSSSEFDSYEIGDTYRMNRYNGAFGEPFFIAD